MNELVLELVTSYENRISAVEELIVCTYNTAMTAEGSVGELDDERQKLRASLQQTLARNCSLRRKDFDILIESVLCESEGRRKGIEEERVRLVEKVKGYLVEQKALAMSLRQQLELAADNLDRAGLDATIANMRTAYQDAAQNLFSLLRDFQLHLQDYCREQEEINHKLQRLVNKGELLKVEDLRRLEATRIRQARKTERDLRRGEVERLLAHFKQHRENYGRRQRAA